MISHISIKNFAIIEDAQIDFDEGLCIITGETGAGKSIIANAIALVLGARADSSFIRSGCDKAVVQMVASHSDDEYIIIRELSANGKNLCKINGEIVTLSQLREVTAQLADIHGQYDTQTLLSSSKHIDIVDLYKKDEIEDIKKSVSKLFHEYRDILLKLKKYKEDLIEYNNRQEFLKEEAKLINDADLKIGEDAELAQKLTTAHNQEKLRLGWENLYNLCNAEDASLIEMINQAQKQLGEISDISTTARDMEREFTELYFKMEDIVKKIRDSRDSIGFSNFDIEYMSERLDMIEALKRRYGTDIKGILEHLSAIENEMQNMVDTAENAEKLNVDKEKIGEKLKVATALLTDIRKKTAEALEAKVQNELDDLHFNHAVVDINFEISNKYTANGRDKIEFMISTNKGEPVKPLAKIASGGEMSRIMLAFKSVIADYDNIDTMIFDEIDNGISGVAASKVGKKLKNLSEKRQIIVITHLPQIAALGDHNYRIVKETSDDRTVANIIRLSDSQKTQEIARMMSGDVITDVAIENAQTLINQKHV